MLVRVIARWVREALYYEVQISDDIHEDIWCSIRSFKDTERNKAVNYAKDLSKFDRLDQAPPVLLMAMEDGIVKND